MNTTTPSQTAPPPSPEPAPYPRDPALALPSDTYYQIVHTLSGLLPAPVTDTPEDLAHRDNAAIAHVASLLPGNADEAHLAARVAAAADAYAMDCLRLAHDCRIAPMLFFKCTAQAASMMREARGARTQLMRIQAERRKRESDNATRDQAAWTEHCAIGLMMQALPGAAPVAIPDPPPPPAPEPAPADEPRTDLAAEADLYAVMYPRRAALIRGHGGVPDNVSFGPPGDDLAHILVTGRTPALLALDAAALA